MNPLNHLVFHAFLASLLLACGSGVAVAADCNSNGVEDATDITGATSVDCNSNGEPDECDTDCDASGTPDDCEVGPQIFVDMNVSGGSGDGSDWANAFPILQDALAAVVPCRTPEVWVADGTYYPDLGASQTADDRNETFNLISGVTIYGGFAGTETSLSQRDINSNATILSGDIGTGSADSLHIVTAANGTDATAVLDGFIITGGRADSAAGNAQNGAALKVGPNSAATIRQSIFVNNLALSGGAAFVEGGITFEDCTFVDNQADIHGGAVFITNHGTIQATGSYFNSNGAGNNGGGIFAGSKSTGTVDRCSFVGNIAQGAGGGMFVTQIDTEHTISNTYFGTNGALGSFEGGGGIAVWTGGAATIFNCVFSDNRADFGGGVSVFDGGSATIVNATFSRNSAVVPGESGGGGLENALNSVSIVVNCIFRGNEDLNGDLNQITQDFGQATLTVSHSNVQGGQAGIFSCFNCTLDYTASNIDADPLFVDSNGPDDRFGTADDNLRLFTGSLSIDTGSNGAAAAIMTDFDGNARIFNTADMGAFENFLDCNGNSLADPSDPMDFNTDGVIDLADFQAFQICFGDTTSNCLAAFDRALDCGAIDLNDYDVFFDQNTGPGGSMMAMGGGGGGARSSMIAAPLEGSETPPPDPWVIKQARLAFELQPQGGGSAVTDLVPNTTYELHYATKADGVTASIFASVSATAAEGLASVIPSPAGAWSDTGNFLFEAFSQGNLISDPDHPGLFRTAWTTDTAVFPGDSQPSAPSAGHLHTITTGDAGVLTLEIYMYYADESAGVWTNMEAARTYQVQP